MQKVCYIAVLTTAFVLLTSCDQAAPTAPPPCATGTAGDWEFLGLAADSLSTVRAVVTSPHDPDRLLAATAADFSGGQAGWLFGSADDGATWAPLLTSGTGGGGVHAPLFDSADPDVAYALPYGVAKTEDGGQTWFPAEAGILLDFDTRAQELLQDRTDPTGHTLLVGTVGAFGGSLYRTTDGAQTWEDLALPPDSCQGPDFPDHCYFASGLASLASSPSDPAVLYAGTNFSGHVLRSADAGVTWEWRTTLLTGLPRSIAVDASNPDLLFAALVRASSQDPSVSRSEDGGRAWARFDEGLPAEDAAGDIVQDPPTGLLYFISGNISEAELWRRGPGEAAWRELATPVEGMDFRSALHLTEDGWLYVGGDGLWRVDLATLTAVESGPCDP